MHMRAPQLGSDCVSYDSIHPALSLIGPNATCILAQVQTTCCELLRNAIPLESLLPSLVAIKRSSSRP